jgi:hypothetical protein
MCLYFQNITPCDNLMLTAQTSELRVPERGGGVSWVVETKITELTTTQFWKNSSYETYSLTEPTFYLSGP